MIFTMQGFKASHVTELDIDDGSVPVLCQLGLHEACPRVNKLTLSWMYTVTTNPIKMVCSSFLQLTELHMKSLTRIPISILNPSTFCHEVVSSCPRLIKLSFSHVGLGNDGASDILQGMKAHSSLKSIT